MCMMIELSKIKYVCPYVIMSICSYVIMSYKSYSVL